MQKFIMTEAKEGDGGGAVSSGYVAEEKKESSPDDHLDEYGYSKPESEEPKKEAKEEVKEEKKEEVKDPDPVSGYDEKSAKAAEPKEEVKEEKKEAAESKEEELDVKGLDDIDAKAIKEFAKKHKVSKEVAADLIEMKKAEYKELEAFAEKRKQEAEELRQKTRQQWAEELKNDSGFGGEKFAYNVKQVDKVINEYMPHLKAELVKSKTQLPPYVMKDLAKLAKHLYSTEKLTQGEKIVEDKKVETKGNDPLAFYT